MKISSNFQDLFEKQAFANLATMMPDCAPQVTPVWIDFDGKYLLVNTAKGRVKDKNMRMNKQVAISIQDPDNPYRNLTVRGRVVEITEEGANTHIDKLAKKYLGQDTYPYHQPGDVRVIFKIEPEKVSVYPPEQSSN